MSVAGCEFEDFVLSFVWRDLRRRPNAGFGLLHKPEITLASISNQSHYATTAEAHSKLVVLECALRARQD